MKDYLTKKCAGSGTRKKLLPDPRGKNIIIIILYYALGPTEATGFYILLCTRKTD
jgi:hypothetical protein